MVEKERRQQHLTSATASATAIVTNRFWPQMGPLIEWFTTTYLPTSYYSDHFYFLTYIHYPLSLFPILLLLLHSRHTQLSYSTQLLRIMHSLTSFQLTRVTNPKFLALSFFIHLHPLHWLLPSTHTTSSFYFLFNVHRSLERLSVWHLSFF